MSAAPALASTASRERSPQPRLATGILLGLQADGGVRHMQRGNLSQFALWGYEKRNWTSKVTTQQYQNAVHRAQRWMTAKGWALDHVDARQLGEYLSAVCPTPSSRNQARKALKAWFDYLVHAGIRTDNPTAEFPALRRRRPLPRAVNETVARGFRPAALAQGPMWAAMVGVLMGGALRADEARLLECASVNGEFLRILGKGNQWRDVPITNPRAAADLHAWLRINPSPRWVFPSPVRLDQPVCYGTIRNHIRAIGEALGLPKLTPHMLRHTAANEMLRRTGNVRLVQSYLGHEEISSTQIYTFVQPVEIADAARQSTLFDDPGAGEDLFGPGVDEDSDVDDRQLTLFGDLG